MCSIFGVTGKKFPADLLQTCFNRTVSRGPDMSRFEPYGPEIPFRIFLPQ